MKSRMLCRDFKRNKAITSTLLLFILLATLLISMASSLIVELSGAVNTLFVDSKAPHFVQMHSGAINQTAINRFVNSNGLVADQQTVEMLNVPGKNITLGKSNITEAASVMEIAFVKQNSDFDYLLNLSGEVANVSAGKVGVPIYFMQQNGLHEGDKVRIECGECTLVLTISCFIRDVQMNPSIVTSKRFLVSDEDWQTIKGTVGTSEYLIEFLLEDITQVSVFEQQYAASDLPQSDTAITYSLFQLLNSLSDGIVAAVIILIGLLLVFISMLCLRYTILGALEEDIREIGIMKAIGLTASDIRSIYVTKYMALVMVASLVGFAISIPLTKLLLHNITLYMGTATKTLWNYLMPLLSVGVVFLLILGMVHLLLFKLKRMSATQALQAGITRKVSTEKKHISLRNNLLKNVNILLALEDIWLHMKSYFLLGFIFVICTFLAITPINLYSTINSPEFVTYMGAGTSDIRIDLQKSEDLQKEYETIIAYLEDDPDVNQYAAFVTGTFQAQDNQGDWVTIKVETGDFSVFPVEYAEGYAPQRENEISLSTMNAAELEKSVGDTLMVKVKGTSKKMTVCGLYQDVTNGGKTAKALLPVDKDITLWHVLNIDTKDNVNIQVKKAEYAKQFSTAKVLDMKDYLEQTLGVVKNQIHLTAIFGVIVAVTISVLITVMFFKMLLAKDTSQIAIMKCIGFTQHDLYLQYMIRAFLVMVTAIILGTLVVGVLGQRFAGLLLSVMGASKVEFIVNPLISYLLCPSLLTCSVILTSFLCSRSTNMTVNLKPRIE